MAKVTSKLQVTIPKALADRHHIKPGDEIEWRDGGQSIHIVPRSHSGYIEDPEERMRSFDAMTERIRKRLEAQPVPPAEQNEERGWKREDLYLDERGLPRGYPR